MTRVVENSAENAGRAKTRASSECDCDSCQTGICPPCLLVWGLVAVGLIINALLEMFQ